MNRKRYKKQVAKNFSLSATRYDELSVIQSKIGEIMLSRFPLKPEGGEILDIGAGSGRITAKVNAVGMDISLSMCMIQKRKNLKTVCADGELLPFKSNTFDAVISNFSIHWMEIDTVMREIKRILKANGVLLFSVPVKGSLEEIFNAWNTTYTKHFGRPDRLFGFKEESAILNSTYRFFNNVEHTTVEKEVKASSAKEAVKMITGTGAKNPYRRIYIPRKVYEDFIKQFELHTNGEFKVKFKTIIVKAS